MKNVKLTVLRPLVSVAIQLKRGLAGKNLVFHQVMRDFLQWSLDQKVYPAVNGHGGPLGFWHSYYTENAEKVLAWWKERGVDTPDSAG